MGEFQKRQQRPATGGSQPVAEMSAAIANSRSAGRDSLVASFTPPPANTGFATPQQVKIRVVRQNNYVEQSSTPVRVWFSQTKNGPHESAASAVYSALTKGSLVDTLSANVMYEIMSDSNGEIEFSLARGSAGTVYVRCMIAAQTVTQSYTFS